MHRWLRFVMVWLVALALPVQGIASATMAHCGASHERMHRAQVDSHQHASAGHHQGADDAGSPHHHHAGAAAAGSSDPGAQSTHDAAQPGKFTDLGDYNCSACASCCSVCALLSPLPRVPAPEFALAVFAATVLAVAAFATDGPDRPPRIALA